MRARTRAGERGDTRTESAPAIYNVTAFMIAIVENDLMLNGTEREVVF